MFNAIKCAYWASTALSHYQKIEVFTKITRHKNNLGRECKNGIILYVCFLLTLPLFVLLQNCAIMLRLLRRKRNCLELKRRRQKLLSIS